MSFIEKRQIVCNNCGRKGAEGTNQQKPWGAQAGAVRVLARAAGWLAGSYGNFEAPSKPMDFCPRCRKERGL